MALQVGFGRTLINPPSHIPAGTWMAQKHVRASGLDMETRCSGYGPPWEREPELVPSDLCERQVRVAHAREHYGVAIDARLRGFDARETANLCRELRRGTPDDA